MRCKILGMMGRQKQGQDVLQVMTYGEAMSMGICKS